MSNINDASQFEKQLKESTQTLLELVDKGDLTEAVNLLQNIYDVRNRNLYQEVGRLTRALHDAIANFHIDIGGSSQATKEMSQMADATDRLGYVIRMTQEAAETTMDRVEECAPLTVALQKEAANLSEDWNKFLRREMQPEEFRNLSRRLNEFLNLTVSDLDRVGEKFGDITLAQGFQDLTGQVLKRVINLVQEVETSLVNLVFMAGQVDRITGITHTPDGYEEEIDLTAADGPQVTTNEVVSGQDEVDDLLSSLGF